MCNVRIEAVHQSFFNGVNGLAAGGSRRQIQRASLHFPGLSFDALDTPTREAE